MKSGFYSGSICFTDVNDKYYWYMIELHSLEPEAEKTLTLEAQCRSVIAVEITVMNPIDATTTFDVVLNGQGLLGETRFTVGPK